MFNAYQYIKYTNVKRVCTVCFRLYNILKKVKLQRQQKGQCVKVLGEKGISVQEQHRKERLNFSLGYVTAVTYGFVKIHSNSVCEKCKHTIRRLTIHRMECRRLLPVNKPVIFQKFSNLSQSIHAAKAKFHRLGDL